MIRHTIISVALAIVLFVSAVLLLAAGMFFSGVQYPFDTDTGRARVEFETDKNHE